LTYSASGARTTRPTTSEQGIVDNHRVMLKALCCSMLVFAVIGLCGIWLRRRRGL
jgi:hypothetical protein